MASDDALAALARARARAEAAEVVGMLAESDTETARVDAADWTVIRRMVAKQAIALDIAVATGRSEGQVINLLAAGRRVRDRAPSTWAAFHRGDIDLVRTREIASTLNLLERPESWDRLDCSVVDYASSHTVAELRAWLKRFVARVEADLAAERATVVRRERRVDVTHGDDSMAWINAFLPSHVATAIDRRLDREARRVRAEALAGSGPGFAISTAGTWAVPVDWILESALATAIDLPDGVCRAPGCLKPAPDCDKDHREPWPAGRTNAGDLWSPCRRHHAMKGHGFPQWQLPSRRTRSADEAEYGPPPAGLGPPSRAGTQIIDFHFSTDAA